MRRWFDSVRFRGRSSVVEEVQHESAGQQEMENQDEDHDNGRAFRGLHQKRAVQIKNDVRLGWLSDLSPAPWGIHGLLTVI